VLRNYVITVRPNSSGDSDAVESWITTPGRSGTAPNASAALTLRSGANLTTLRVAPTANNYTAQIHDILVYRDAKTAAECALLADTADLQSIVGVATDTTAPTLSIPTGTGGTLAAAGTVSTNEAGGTLYYLASPNATETVPAQGSPMTGWASQPVTAAGVQNVSVTGLAAGTWHLHYAQDDAATTPNRSARASSASFVVSGGATTYSLVLSQMANNTGAGVRTSTTFTGELVYGGDFDAIAGKTIHTIGTTAVDANGNATLTGLPQTGPAMLLRKWAGSNVRSAEFVTVA
jgi:hypothetical protein